MLFKRKNKLKIDSKKDTEELDELRNNIQLEKNDTLAMIIAAITTFLPAVILVFLILVLLIHLIIPLF